MEIFTKTAERHALMAQKEEAASALAALQQQLESAYNVFNNTADPEVLEASILEIGALQAKYGCALRSLKRLSGALP